MQNSPGGRPYLRSRPVGLEGVAQSMLTSFLRHWSMSTELKKATDWGRSCMPNALANILLQETQAHNQESSQGYSLFYGGYFWQGRIKFTELWSDLVSRFVIWSASAALWRSVLQTRYRTSSWMLMQKRASMSCSSQSHFMATRIRCR